MRIRRPVWPAASLLTLHGERFDVPRLRRKLLGGFAMELQRQRKGPDPDRETGKRSDER